MIRRSLRSTATALLLCGWIAVAGGAFAQQVGDHGFVPEIESATYESGKGPRVAIDQAHHNFHTRSGRYATFAELLEADGYVVDTLDSAFAPDILRGVDLLVISNALNARNVEDWDLPNPSAFTESEIDAVVTWVSEGGSLLLVADHMPFPGAANDLAAAFGFEMNNGFAMDTTRPGPLVFHRGRATLSTHAITDGPAGEERIDSVATFTGQAFRSPPEATDLLIIPDGVQSLMPERAWEFDSTTTAIDVAGWSQGSVMDFGLGRLAVFGEAAMFTAQLAGPQRVPVGINAPVASQNAAFVLNLARWLTSR